MIRIMHAIYPQYIIEFAARVELAPGFAAERWKLKQRIERAKELLDELRKEIQQ